MSRLPLGWCVASVGDLTTVLQYGSSAKTSENGDIPILRMGNIVEGRLRLEALKYLPKTHPEFPELLLAPGDVLFNRTNSPELVGKSAVYEGVPSPCSFASYLLRLRFRSYEPPLFAHYVNSSYGRAWIASVVQQQVGQANVNGSKLREFEVPVPPLPEQRRIVAKLDDLLARSRRAKAALDAIPPLLNKLRQSILASAFRGDLTADWRAKNPDVEPAHKLLTRIRVERRKKWEEAELAKMRAKGKAPGDDKWKQKYVEPEPVDAEGLPELPEGWCWASVNEVSTAIVDCPHSTPSYGNGEYRAIDTTCMLPGLLVVDRLRHVDRNTYDLRTRRLVPHEGDVVFAREGTVGTAVSLPAKPAVCLGQRVMLMRPSSHLKRRWLELALMSVPVINQYTVKLVGSTVEHLNVGEVVRLAVPVPPDVEQQMILEIVGTDVRRVESLGRIALRACEQQTSLVRSLLTKAFQGALVPQDPADEPAATMLARLRAAPSAAPTKPPRRRASKTPA